MLGPESPLDRVARDALSLGKNDQLALARFLAERLGMSVVRLPPRSTDADFNSQDRLKVMRHGHNHCLDLIEIRSRGEFVEGGE